jgi:arylsulfatase A-like enzyme
MVESRFSSKFYNPLPYNMTTLAEILSENGYRCGGISANFLYAGRMVHMDQGFEFFWSRENPLWARSRPFDLQSYFIGLIQLYILPRHGFIYSLITPTAQQINSLALDWIDSVKGDQPYFLFLNYMEAHDPYYPPARLINLFPGFKAGMPRETEISLDMLEKKRPLTELEHAHLISQYDACLVYLDEQLRKLEDELRKRSLYDDSFIVLVSDHGEFFGEHNYILHGKHLYSEVLDVPLILKYPGGKPSGIDDSLIENRALFNIVLKQAKVNIAPTDLPWEAAAERYGTPPTLNVYGTRGKEFAHDRRAVNFEHFKFISSRDGEEELYDLQVDPAETANLVEILPEKSEQARNLINRFLESVEEYRDEEDHVEERLTPEEIRQLRALGYMH